ncbi:MAG TPA: hypothetical protein VF641_04240 [Methylobacterium sp.]|jgi:hypothetical protein
MLSIGQALVTASGLFGRSASRMAAPKPQDMPERFESSEADAPSAEEFVLGSAYVEAVESALKDAGYLDS